MAGATTLHLRRLWFQLHKWIGILLAILLIPLSLSGSALVWHEPLERLLYPQRFVVKHDIRLLSPSAYIASARPHLKPDDRVSMLEFGKHGLPVVITAVRAPAKGEPARGGPARTSIWLDRTNGKVLDVAQGDAGILRTLHMLHGNLMVPGVGRQIVGWLGIAMLISCLTGIWLWWPTVGRWTRGLRWRRTREFDTNLHHLAGFWIAIPLAMLCFTGAWISFPAFLGALTGQAPRTNQLAAMRALPLVQTRQNADHVLASVAQSREAFPLSITWPTDASALWKVSLVRKKTLAFTVDDASGAIAPGTKRTAEGPSGLAGTMRHWHDGTGMGIVWQTIIFISGLIPAILGVTGILMWLRTRKWRAEIATRGGRAFYGSSEESVESLSG